MTTKEQIITQTIPASFSAIAGGFLVQSLEHMIPWLIVSASVVLCDLFFGLRKALIMGEEIRFSGAVRRTMGKMVTYFAFVCMVVMIDIASGVNWRIDVWSCLLICFIEFCSILSNFLKPKGIKFNIAKAFSVAASKALKVEKDDLEGVIIEEKKEVKDEIKS